MSGGALVSVGLPVRDGVPHVERALANMLGQSYRPLEVVVSDNCSTDGTEAICRRVAAQDARVRYVRQPRPLTAVENFRAAFEASRGELFLWAAHDDVRSARYVEVLVEALAGRPDASLAFGELAEFPVGAGDPEAAAEPADDGAVARDTTGLSPGALARFAFTSNATCRVYGLIRAACLRDYGWPEIEFGPDYPLLLHLAARGPIVHAPGAVFYRGRPLEPKDPASRARANSFRDVGRARRARLAWVCARTMSRAYAARGEWRPAVALFPALFDAAHRSRKALVYGLTPRFVRRAFARARGRRGLPT